MVFSYFLSGLKMCFRNVKRPCILRFKILNCLLKKIIKSLAYIEKKV